MIDAITALQGALVAALKADTSLDGLLAGAIFDAPPRGTAPPYLAVIRHDAVPRDGDAAPGFEHRVIVHLWHADPSRKAVLAMAERVRDVALGAALDPGDWLVTTCVHQRTDTAIDLDTGRARAALTFTFFTEPR